MNIIYFTIAFDGSDILKKYLTEDTHQIFMISAWSTFYAVKKQKLLMEIKKLLLIFYYIRKKNFVD